MSSRYSLNIVGMIPSLRKACVISRKFFCCATFGGVSFGKAEVDEHTQRADVTSYVGGLTYERIFCNTFLGLALAVGYVNWDNERFVMHDSVEDGVETAKADTGGAFFSSEATLAHRFDALWCFPIMSFTFRYAGLFLGDYSEKGSLAA